jgi:hypothetical protein
LKGSPLSVRSSRSGSYFPHTRRWRTNWSGCLQSAIPSSGEAHRGCARCGTRISWRNRARPLLGSGPWIARDLEAESRNLVTFHRSEIRCRGPEFVTEFFISLILAGGDHFTAMIVSFSRDSKSLCHILYRFQNHVTTENWGIGSKLIYITRIDSEDLVYSMSP